MEINNRAGKKRMNVREDKVVIKVEIKEKMYKRAYWIRMYIF